jgi:hypothetical protein
MRRIIMMPLDMRVATRRCDARGRNEKRELYA